MKLKDNFTNTLCTYRTDPLKWIVSLWMMTVMAAIMLFVVIGDRGKSLVDTLMLLSSLMIFGALLAQKRMPRNAECALLASYAIWLTGTRFLHGDYTLAQSVDRLSTAWFGMAVCFVAPFLFTSEQGRKKFRLTVANIAVGFGVLCTLLSIAIVVFDLDIRVGNLLDFSDWIFLYQGRLYFTGHPNLIGQILCVGVCSAIICAAEIKKKQAVAAYIAAVFVMLMGISMTDSRTSSIGACIAISVSAGFFAYRLLNLYTKKKNIHKAVLIAASVLCCILAFAVSHGCLKMQRSALEYVGNNANTGILNELSSETVDTGELLTGDAGELLTFSDRGYDDLNNVKSMSGRTVIFRFAFETLKNNPEILLAGQLFDDSPIDISGFEGGNWNFIAMHWHNSYIEVVFEAGVVGLLLIVSFVILMVIRFLKTFWGSFKSNFDARAYSLLVPAITLLFSMLEPTLFSTFERYIPKLTYMFFLVWCGIIVSEIELGRRKEQKTAKK